MAAQGPFRLEDAAGICALGETLASAGYTPDGLEEALPTKEVSYDDPRELPFLLRLLPPGERLSTLIRLFRLTVPVPRREAASALHPVRLERVVRMGLLIADGDDVESPFRLFPFADLILAGDREPRRGSPPHDHVLGVTTGTLLLSNLAVRLPVDSALDMGTGGGVQALALARHSTAVDGVDVNPRALNVAAFNASLNGVSNVRLLEGDLFAPVAGNSYDLIVANPPYVISPDERFAFRDAGLHGDALSEAVVRELPRFLRDGGIAHVLIEWAHRREGDFAEPVRRWVVASGCDAVLLRYASHDPLTYAAGWNRLPASTGARDYERAIVRWTEYFETLGIEAIGTGALVLRRRAGNNSFFSHAQPSPTERPAGHHVFRLLRAQEFLAGLPNDDRALLAEPLVPAEDHRLEQAVRFRGGEGVVEQTILRLEDGLRLRVRVDALTVDVLSHLDSGRSAGEVLAQLAADRPELDRNGLVESGLRALRRLVELGFVLPALDRVST